MLQTVFLLLVLFQVKHFLADYPLQNGYMLGKFKPGWDFAGPLAAHAGVHALFTFAIVFAFVHSVLFSAGMAVFDFVVHFTMDRMKAGPNYLGRWKALSATEFPTATAKQKKGNTYFWQALGFDQMVHHLTHYAIIAFIVFI